MRLPRRSCLAPRNDACKHVPVSTFCGTSCRCALVVQKNLFNPINHGSDNIKNLSHIQYAVGIEDLFDTAH